MFLFENGERGKMELIIRNRQEEYEINLQPITQLCGLNLLKKKYILDSLCKHFSNTRYASYEEEMRENVYYAGGILGRKYFKVYRISNRENLLSAIKISKSSLMMQYLTSQYNRFDYQIIIQEIKDRLDQLFLKINEDMVGQFSYIEINHEMKALMEVIQTSEAYGKGEKELEVLSNYELLCTYVDLLYEIIQFEPENILLILENIDHFLKYTDYVLLMKKLEKITQSSDLQCICSSGIQDYVMIDASRIEGIHVINDEIFRFPEMEKVRDFIKRNYPCERQWQDDEIYRLLQNIIHDIGRESYGRSLRSEVLLQLFNDTFGLKKWGKTELNQIEKAFLERGDML